MDRRRFLLTSLTGALAIPIVVDAQPAKPSRVGYLSLAPGPSPRSEALRDGFHDLGYAEGRDLVLEYRWTAGSLDRAREAAEDLVRLKVDVIVTGGPRATLAAKERTRATPIVMAVDYDPVGAGFIASLARPGGNITGLSAINPELSSKRLHLLKEAVPPLSRVAVLLNPANRTRNAFFVRPRGERRNWESGCKSSSCALVPTWRLRCVEQRKKEPTVLRC